MEKGIRLAVCSVSKTRFAVWRRSSDLDAVGVQQARAAERSCLMFKSIGVCGTGNMGRLSSRTGGIESHCRRPPISITSGKAAALAEETELSSSILLGISQRSQALIMGVKPNMMEKALASVRDGLSSDSVVISIAAGRVAAGKPCRPCRKRRKSSASCPIHRLWWAGHRARFHRTAW